MILPDNIISWLSTVNWGSVPDWLAAIGTISAVIAALYLADKGTREQRLRERRAQAISISTYRNLLGNKTVGITVMNNSNANIYDIAISIAVSVGAGEAFQKENKNNIFIRGIPPGKFKIDPPKVPKKSMGMELGIAISFRDAQGVYWRRDAVGNLYETESQEPYSGLDVTQPISKYESFSVVS